MMTRKTLHHHRWRERDRERKKTKAISSPTSCARRSVYHDPLLKTCIKASNSPNKYSYIYIFPQALYQKQSRSSSVVQNYASFRYIPEKAFFSSPFLHAKDVHSPLRLIHALSLDLHTCITVKNNKNKTSKHTLAQSQHGYKKCTPARPQQMPAYVKTRTEKGAFLFTQSQTFASGSHNFNDSQSQATLCSQHLWKLPCRMIEKQEYIW